MPIYEMQCQTCGKIIEFLTFDIENKKNEFPKKCEICQGKLKKFIAGKFGFRLNGECWAKDNYSYEYTKSKAGEPKQPNIHGRKTIDKKLKALRMK